MSNSRLISCRRVGWPSFSFLMTTSLPYFELERLERKNRERVRFCETPPLPTDYDDGDGCSRVGSNVLRASHLQCPVPGYVCQISTVTEWCRIFREPEKTTACGLTLKALFALAGSKHWIIKVRTSRINYVEINVSLDASFRDNICRKMFGRRRSWIRKARLLPVCVNCHEQGIFVCRSTGIKDGERGGWREGKFPADGDCLLYGRTDGRKGLLFQYWWPIAMHLCLHALLCSSLIKGALSGAARLSARLLGLLTQQGAILVEIIFMVCVVWKFWGKKSKIKVMRSRNANWGLRNPLLFLEFTFHISFYGAFKCDKSTVYELCEIWTCVNILHLWRCSTSNV